MASTIRAALRFHPRNSPTAAVFRPQVFPRHPQPRFASSSSPSSLDQAQKTAQNAYSSASKHAGNAFQKAQKAAGPLGERIANMLGGVYLVYHSSVQKHRCSGLRPAVFLERI